MIVIDEPTKPAPSATTPLLANLPPPAYTAAPSNVPAPQRDRPSTRKRLASVFMAMIFVSTAFVLAFFAYQYEYERSKGVGDEYPIPSGVSVSKCTKSWSKASRPPTSSFPHNSLTSFSLPLPAQTLMLLSQGALSSGRVKIVASSAYNVQVKVTVSYHTTLVRGLAKVCLVERSDGEQGVGIFSPQPWKSRDPKDLLSFDVEIALPRSKDTRPRMSTALFTNVTNFSQELDNLEDVMEFGAVTLLGSNGGIHSAALVTSGPALLMTSNGLVRIEKLVASSAHVMTINAPVYGTYHTNGPLQLTTINAPIDAKLSVTSQDWSPVTLSTMNGHISAVVGLTSPVGAGGSFPVKTQNFNGDIFLNVSCLPINATLSLTAGTMNSRADVVLPPTFEGRYSLSTSMGTTAVQRRHPDERDPEYPALDRKRVLTEERVGGTRMGNVYWAEENANRGVVAVSGQNGPVRLVL
ncbi:hypothetical protein MKEN_00405500 [Mycena kentingensis (nom. inval.)]|nr:hypothetical protein MKEN_00405500 [Mycena kentingensis (nom. inval.)]